jgi:hypothetical protein
LKYQCVPGAGERQVRAAHHGPQHQRRREHQHDIERQHVEIDRLVAQCQCLPDQFVRMGEEVGDVELVLVHRIVELPRGAGDLRRERQEQQDVGDVHLPGSHPEPLGGREQIARLDDRAVDVTGQITGNEHEEFGGVAEAVVSHRQPGHDVVRDVIEEDHPQTEAAKEIEPKITFDGFREGCFAFRHITCPFDSDGQYI